MSRHIDDELLMDLAGQVGLDTSQSVGTAAGRNGGSPASPQDARREALAAAEAMKGKSEDEILSEIMKLKSRLQKNPEAYEKQIRAVKSLRGMMNPEQRKRLDHVLQLLER